MTEVSVFHRAQSLLGEGPVWHDAHLWWVDIEQGLLNRVDASGNHPQSWNVGQRLGCAVPARDGSWLLGLQDGIGCLNLETGTVKLLAQPESHHPEIRFNDGKTDPAGRFLCGTMPMNDVPGSGALHSWSQGKLRTLQTGVTISNGLAWSADEQTLYYIDTPTFEIVAFDYDTATGAISGRRSVVSIPREAGYPDGMSIDTENNLWVAHWDGSAVRCWSPYSGKCLDEIPVPCLRPTSCCFGGPGLDQLFITSARVDLDEKALIRHPHSGDLFVCQPGVKGTAITLANSNR